MGRRFRNLARLGFLPTSELEALKRAQDGGLWGIKELRGECTNPSQADQLEQVGSPESQELWCLKHPQEPFRGSFQQMCDAVDVDMHLTCIL